MTSKMQQCVICRRKLACMLARWTIDQSQVCDFCPSFWKELSNHKCSWTWTRWCLRHGLTVSLASQQRDWCDKGVQDLLVAADGGDVTALYPHDLTAAFDTIDHEWNNNLVYAVSFSSGLALIMCDSTLQVMYAGIKSSMVIPCHVLQCSVFASVHLFHT